jgi:hypothetical protein
MAGYPRTQGEAVLDVKYAARLHERHQRFFRRVRWTFSVIQLASVSALLAPYLSEREYPILGTIGGAVLLTITILDVVTDFAAKDYQHRDQRKAYLRLVSMTGGMSLDELDTAIRKLEADDDTTVLESLRVVAYNDNLRSNGYESAVRPEDRLTRLMRVLS